LAQERFAQEITSHTSRGLIQVLVAMKSVVFVSFLFAAVSGAWASTKTQNIVQLAQATPDLSTLVAALTAGGLTDCLSGEGPFTVFAPTNEAFAKIETKALNALLQNKAALDKVLEYHVLEMRLHGTELMDVKSVKTLEGENVAISNGKGASRYVIKVNNAKVLTADVAASNGIVHIIDTVLMTPSGPPLPLKRDIVHVAEGNADLSTLVAALTAGKLVATLEGKGPFTVFAPTNEAFAKIPAADLQKLLANTKELDAVLEYHVLSGKFDMRDLMAVRSAKTLEGDSVTVSGSGKVVNVNDAKVLKADVAATNGIVHVIDTVLSLPSPSPPAPTAQNIVQLAEHTKDLSILVGAIAAAGLADTLSAPGHFTVFAPTDAAFKALPAGTLAELMKPENKKKLADILLYHVLPEKVLSTDLKTFQAVTTVEGKPVHVTKWGGHVKVGASLRSKDLKDVIAADNLASNGVVHIIDGVLLPPAHEDTTITLV